MGLTSSSFYIMINCIIKLCCVFNETYLCYYFLCLTIYIFYVLLITKSQPVQMQPARSTKDLYSPELDWIGDLRL